MTDCIIFDGCISKDGYGRKYRDGKVYNAHRLVWIDAHGDPGDLVVDHICRNRACINLGHLRLLTRGANVSAGIPHTRLKTACPRGHAYTGTDNRGKRICHTCKRIRYHERKTHALDRR